MVQLSRKLRSHGLKGSIIKIYNKALTPLSKNYFENPDLSAVDRFGPSELAVLFQAKTGNQVHKWHHYLEIYERHLGEFRGRDVRILEIGVFRGGSLELWREYFGERARIFGIDINPDCAKFDGIAGNVRIGSQADADFLRSVVEEMGGVDIVIDDGSHDSIHIKKSFDVLFPLLSDGGCYIAEDLHCAYWPAFSGGYRVPWSFINVSKKMIDDIHHWYHNKGERNASTKGILKALHFYDSVIVFEKGKVEAPVCSLRPSNDEESFIVKRNK